jgi:signal-transduction protein with cAMP-binding, CBS, and nucleotidyltransferase domain
MRLREILRVKGHHVHTIAPDATSEDVVDELVRHNVGSLIVFCNQGSEGETMVGIVTERDVLRSQAQNRDSHSRLLVQEIMTSDPVTTAPDTHLHEAMWLMTSRRIRHLPVVEEGKLLGIISIGDIVKAHHDLLEMENHYMKSYIQGEGADVGTPT